MLKILLELLIITPMAVFLVKYNSDVVIYFSDYELNTTVLAMGLGLFCCFLVGYCCGIIRQLFFAPNGKKILKKMVHQQENYKKFDEHLANTYLQLQLNDLGKAEKTLQKANKLVKNTSIVKYFKSQLYYRKNRVVDALNLFKSGTKSRDKYLLVQRLKLEHALNTKNEKEILTYGENILKLQPDDVDILNTRYSIYKNKGDFSSALGALEQMKKLCKKEFFRKEKAFLLTALAQEQCVDSNLAIALDYVLEAYKLDKNSLATNLCLVNTLNRLKDKRLDKYLMDIWKTTPLAEMGDMYLTAKYGDAEDDKLLLKEAKRLYSKNKTHPESLLFMANICIKAREIEGARKYLETIQQNQWDTRMWQTLLSIEKIDRPNTEIARLLKEKLEKMEPYHLWQCSSCGESSDIWSGTCPSCADVESLKSSYQ